MLKTKFEKINDFIDINSWIVVFCTHRDYVVPNVCFQQYTLNKMLISLNPSKLPVFFNCFCYLLRIPLLFMICILHTCIVYLFLTFNHIDVTTKMFNFFLMCHCCHCLSVLVVIFSFLCSIIVFALSLFLYDSVRLDMFIIMKTLSKFSLQNLGAFIPIMCISPFIPIMCISQRQFVWQCH